LFGNKIKASLRPMLGPQFRRAALNESAVDGRSRVNYLGTSNVGMKMTLHW